MAWYDSIIDTGTQIFSWMEDNPTAASFIGGAAMGALSYVEIRSQQKEERRLRQEERDYRSTFGGASTTTAGKTPPNYIVSDEEGGLVTGGKITQGNITGFKSAF